jgi:hypothetical protein
MRTPVPYFVWFWNAEELPDGLKPDWTLKTENGVLTLFNEGRSWEDVALAETMGGRLIQVPADGYMSICFEGIPLASFKGGWLLDVLEKIVAS